MQRFRVPVVLVAIVQLAAGARAVLADPVCTGTTPVAGTSIKTQLVVSGLAAPLFVTAPPGDVDRIFIVEEGGLIRIVKDGVLLPTPFLDLSGFTTTDGERGLLGLAFHPNYSSNGRFFVDYTDLSGNINIAEYAVSGDPDVAATSGTILLTIPHFSANNHNGGEVMFGPDGDLYIGVGDGGGAGDNHGTIGNGQDTTVLLGKLLRIDVDGAPPYAIPPSNPFFGSMTNRPEIFAYGLRNPWRYSFDLGNGDLYIGDVGQNAWEEVDYEPVGAGGGQNYGWRLMEGLHCYNPSNCSQVGLTLPLINYDHGQGCAVMGGYVYRGCSMPDLHGTYFYGDLCTAFIRSFQVAGGVATNPQDYSSALGGGTTIGSIGSFGQDARGELYVLDISAGKVFKIVHAVPPPPASVIPAEPRWGIGLMALFLISSGVWVIRRSVRP